MDLQDLAIGLVLSGAVSFEHQPIARLCAHSSSDICCEHAPTGGVG
jgi:hypothetical protein